jgi:hypothetical protein
MDISKNKKIFDYTYKAVLSVLALFILYNLVSILFVSRLKERKLWSRISSTTSTLEGNLKRAHPPAEVDTTDTMLAHNVYNIHFNKSIKETLIFGGPIRERKIVDDGTEGRPGPGTVPIRKPNSSIPTQISLKGVADQIALVNVRRKIDEVWHEYSFPLRNSDQIGAEKIIKNVKYDFATNCVIEDIVSKVERPVTMRKRVVLLSDAGKFIGTKMVKGETFKKKTAKIIYKDEDGVIEELWLGETKIITEEPKEEPKWREDPLGAAKSHYDKASSSIKEKLTKD